MISPTALWWRLVSGQVRRLTTELAEAQQAAEEADRKRASWAALAMRQRKTAETYAEERTHARATVVLRDQALVRAVRERDAARTGERRLAAEVKQLRDETAGFRKALGITPWRCDPAGVVPGSSSPEPGTPPGGAT